MSDKEKSLTGAAKDDRQLSIDVLEQFATNALKAWENPDKIRRVFAPDLSNDEFSFFMGMGIALKANPFKKEIFAVKYDKDTPADIVVSRALYRRVAQEQENYGGAIVETLYPGERFAPNKYKPKDSIHDIDWLKRTESNALPIGAYFYGIYTDDKIPIFHFVKFSEYAKKYRDKKTGEYRLQSTWRSMPETMIKKVADSQGHRLMYQGLFSGTMTHDEYDPDFGTGAELVDDEPEEKTAAAAQTIQIRANVDTVEDALPETEKEAAPLPDPPPPIQEEDFKNECNKHQWATEEPYQCVMCGADNPSYGEVNNQIEDNVKETEEEQRAGMSDHDWPAWEDEKRESVLRKFKYIRTEVFVKAVPALKEQNILNMMQFAKNKYQVEDFHPKCIDPYQYEDAKVYLNKITTEHKPETE